MGTMGFSSSTAKAATATDAGISAAADPASYSRNEIGEVVETINWVPSLPVDLVINILSRLPVKVLGMFKCVSKQWLSIISDPFFIHTHKSRSLENPNLLLLRKHCNFDENEKTLIKKSTTVELCSMDFEGKHIVEFTLNMDDAIDLLPSKWDLICFAGENGFYVCNPTTQEFVKLPEVSCCTSGDINAGMGYIPERNEYILIHLFDRSLDIHVDYDIGCEVIRLSDGCVKDTSWKVMDANCPYVVRGWGVLIENVFYWMIWEEYVHIGDKAIVSFDLEKEVFGTVSPPEGCFDPKGVWFLLEMKGCLCLVDSESHPFTMDIWALKDCKNHEWTKDYSIDLNRFNNELLMFIIPLDHRDGEILMDAKQESLYYYDVENKSFKQIVNLITGEWTWLRLYTESFFSMGSR